MCGDLEYRNTKRANNETNKKKRTKHTRTNQSPDKDDGSGNVNNTNNIIYDNDLGGGVENMNNTNKIQNKQGDSLDDAVMRAQKRTRRRIKQQRRKFQEIKNKPNRKSIFGDSYINPGGYPGSTFGRKRRRRSTTGSSGWK